MIVSNSSPIIILGKQGMLDILKKCFKKVIIPKRVYDEVMHKKDSPESITLKKGINDKWIVIEKTAVSAFLHTKNLGQGEKEAISLAVKHKSLLLIDDDSAKTYATVLNVEVHGTFYVIYIALLKNFISKSQAKKILEDMIANGFYISTDIYSRFLDLLNSLK